MRWFHHLRLDRKLGVAFATLHAFASAIASPSEFVRHAVCAHRET